MAELDGFQKPRRPALRDQRQIEPLAKQQRRIAKSDSLFPSDELQNIPATLAGAGRKNAPAASHGAIPCQVTRPEA